MWQPGWEWGLGRTDTCICMAESLHCSPESITTLLIEFTPIQNKKLKKKCKEQANKLRSDWAIHKSPGGEQSEILSVASILGSLQSIFPASSPCPVATLGFLNTLSTPMSALFILLLFPPLGIVLSS